MASNGTVVNLVRRYIDSSTNEDQGKLLTMVSKLLSSRTWASLDELVAGLGVYLTSEDVNERRKASQLLAELMHRLEPNFLNQKESELLALFFVDRLKDHHSIQPQVIYGLLGLISYFKLTDQNVIQICQAIFSGVHVQSLTQADRRNIFNLFGNMLEKYIKPLRDMGSDFVPGFIQSMDGEKDPRNLLVCFENVQQIISKLQFEVFAEDLFEVTSCYFPIDFNPPPNDPHGITKEELVVQLRQCLASTHTFAPFCMPLLVEKITSDILDAKIDAYITLAACSKVYKPDDMEGYYRDLWNAVRGDYLLGGINLIEDACLSALQGTAVCLSGKTELCKDFVEMVLQECEQSLKDPDLNLQDHLGKIIKTLVFSCETVFEMTFSRIIKFLGSLINEGISRSHNAALMPILDNLIQDPFLQDQNKIPVNSIFSSEQHTVAYFLTVLSSSDVNAALMCSSFKNLLVLLCHGCLTKSDKSIFMEKVLEQIYSTSDERSLATLFHCIFVICERNMELKDGYFREILEENIVDNAHRQRLDEQMDKKTKRSLNALFYTLQSEKDALTTVHKLFEKSDNLLFIQSDVLQLMIKIVEKFPNTVNELETWFIPALLKMIEISSNAGNDAEFWDMLMALFQEIMCNLTCHAQNRWLKYLVEGSMGRNNSKGSFLYGANEAKRMKFINSFLCTARESPEILEFQRVMFWIQQEVLDLLDSSIAIEYGCKCYASLLNKMAEGELLTKTIKDICEDIDKTIYDKETAIKKKESAALLLIWITKSNVLRWSVHTPLLLTRIISLISDPIMGRFICQNFYVLTKDYNDCLSIKLHTNQRAMYKQRLVDFLLPKLLNLHKMGNDSVKSLVSKAISSLFQQLPKPIVQKKMLPMIPLFIHSLSLSDNMILSSTLSTFNTLEDPVVLKNHVTSIIPRLLSLAKAQESMYVRVEAIKLLNILSSLPVHCIYPYRLNVIRCLKSCLDDKKRLVRKEACRCRNQWYLVLSSE